jgi:hypothetical protein
MSFKCKLSVSRAYNYNIVAYKAIYSHFKSNYIIYLKEREVKYKRAVK